MKKSIVISGVFMTLVYYILFKSTIPGTIDMIGRTVYNEGETYERAWDAYEQLPDKVQDMFEDNNYKMYIVESIDNNEYIVGQTRYGPRIVLIREDGKYVERTTFHECGHILDDELVIGFSGVSDTEEFIEIYNAEKDKFVADNNVSYYISTPAEYFASAFAEYMLNPTRLKENTPRTYAFIEQQLK